MQQVVHGDIIIVYAADLSWYNVCLPIKRCKHFFESIHLPVQQIVSTTIEGADDIFVRPIVL